MKKRKILFIIIGLLWVGISLLVYPFVQLPSNEERQEVQRFGSILKACTKQRQEYKIKKFEFVEYAIEIDYLRRFSFLQRWRSFEGLPLHLRYAASIRTLGWLGRYWLFFDNFRLVDIYRQKEFCMSDYPKYPQNVWRKGDRIRFSAAAGGYYD